MAAGRLAGVMRERGDVVAMLRNSQIGMYVYPVVASEFTNWRDEQIAWRQTAVLFDQSHHMAELHVRGRDVLRLLAQLGVNGFAGFGRNRANQLVCVSPEGFVIGDAILFGLEDDHVNIVGRPCLPNWVQFHAETGGWDVTVERDERSADAPDRPRNCYRFEIQGPKAMAILEAVNEGGPLVTSFFQMGEITIAGARARTLAHGMGGAEGLALWGSFEDGPRVKAALLAAGRPHGLRQAGHRAYATVAMESGSIPSPLPAIYTGEALRPYREWLSARSFEAVASIGGSLESDRVEDYYLTPWDLDCGRLIRFDHDFVGRKALEAMASRPHRRKVTLVWEKAEVLKVQAGYYEPGPMPKFMEWPAAHYAAHPYDMVVSEGRMVGISTYPVHTANERAWISLAMVDEGCAEPGTRLAVIRGERDGGSAKPQVERHRQVEVGAVVQPWPIHEASRPGYRRRT